MNILDKFTNFFKDTWIDEAIAIALLISLVEQCAQNNLKNANTNQQMMFGLLFYIGVGWILHYSYHNFSMSKVNIVWSCVSIIASITLGYLLYDEGFSIKRAMSLIFALAAIYCAV